MRKSLPVSVLLVLCACNRAPRDHSAAINPPEPTALDDLLATTPRPATDPDGDPVSYRFAWTVDGAEWGSDQLVPAAETSKGQRWEVSITPTDGDKDGDPATAAVVIGNTPPAVLSVAFDPETPGVEDDVTVVPELEDADGDAAEFSVVWWVDDLVTGYEEATLPSSATKKGQRWTAVVTPFDGEDEGESFSAHVDIDNTAPVMLTLTLSPTEGADEGTVFSAVATAEDDDGDELEFVFSWLVNGEVVREGTQSSLAGSYFNKGDVVGVRAVANDGFVDSEPLEATEQVLVGNSVPSLTGLKVDPATLYEASIATCRTVGWEDEDPLDFEANHFTWYVNSVSVGTEKTLTGDYFDKHDTVWCTAVPYDSDAEGELVQSASVEVSNSAPSLGSVALSNTAPSKADTLSVTLTGASDDDGDEIGFTYQWVVDGTVVGTDSTLAGADFSRGDSIYALVTPVDDEDLAGSAVKSDTATAVNAVPVVSNLTLTPDPGYTDDNIVAEFDVEDADGDTVTYTYAWTVDGASDSTTTGTLPKARHTKNQVIGLVVTPTDSQGDSGAAVTASPLTISNSLPSFIAATISPTTATVSTVLTCETTGWKDTDQDSEGYVYAWTVGTVTVGTAQTLPAGSATKGQSVVCSATAWDGQDTGNTETSSSVSVENSLPVANTVSITPSTAYETSVLTASATGSDDDGDTVTFTYKWYIDGVLRGTGTQLTGADFDRDDKVFVRATPHDGSEAGAYKLTNVTIQNSTPTISSVNVTPALPVTTATLTASVVASDDDGGDTVTVTYVWLIDNTPVSTSTLSTLPSSMTAKGDVVSLQVTPSDGTAIGATTTVSSAVTVQNSPPSAPVVSLSPALPMEGVHDLVCGLDTPSTDLDGDTITYDFAWTVGTTSWTGSTGTFDQPGDLISAGDIAAGESWTCTVTPDDGDDPGSSDTSDTVIVLPECDNSTTWTDTDYVGGTNSRGVTVYDVDEDGIDDVAFGNVGDAEVQIYFGDGTGSFPAYSTVNVGGVIKNAAFGDYDGDGDVDMVTSNLSAGLLYFIDGKGGGTFETAFTNQSQSSGPTWVELADIDDDGDLDLLVTLSTSNCIARRLNTNGSFGGSACIVQNTSARPIGGDFDNDGATELMYVSGGSIHIVEFTSQGNFSTSTTLSPASLSSVSAAYAYDIDDDGDDDILAFGVSASNGSTALVTYLDYYDDYGNLTECDVGDSLSVVAGAAGDFDDDGVPDFASASVCPACSSTYTTWLND